MSEAVFSSWAQISRAKWLKPAVSRLAAYRDKTWLWASSPLPTSFRGLNCLYGYNRAWNQQGAFQWYVSDCSYLDFKFNLKLQLLVFRNISPVLKVQVLLPHEYKRCPDAESWAGVSADCESQLWISKIYKQTPPSNHNFDHCLCITSNPTCAAGGFLKLCCFFWVCGSVS